MTKNMPAILAIQNLRVEYRTRDRQQPLKVAVKNLTLPVNAGEVFGSLDPSGGENHHDERHARFHQRDRRNGDETELHFLKCYDWE